MGAISTASGRLEVNLILSEKRGGKSHFGIIHSQSFTATYMQTKQDPREPVLLMAVKIILHAKLCLLMSIFLICVCWHPERICRALYG